MSSWEWAGIGPECRDASVEAVTFHGHDCPNGLECTGEGEMGSAVLCTPGHIFGVTMMLLPISVSHQGAHIGYCQQLTDNWETDTSVSLGETEGDRWAGKERQRKGEGERGRGRDAVDTLSDVMVPGRIKHEAHKRQTHVLGAGRDVKMCYQLNSIPWKCIY